MVQMRSYDPFQGWVDLGQQPADTVRCRGGLFRQVVVETTQHGEFQAAQDCIIGAGTSALIAIGIAGPTAGTGLVVTLGCAAPVFAGVLADAVTDNETAENQANRGLGYLGFLADVATIAGAIF